MIPLAAINQLAAVYRGRGRNEAYLEFAQEHFLDWLRQERLFEDETVVLKGGTAIRTFVLGNDGRFSTDLDFAVADPVYADHILGVDVPSMLETIAAIYGRMGVPTGDIEARLAACRFGDLHWARTLYAERALELRRDGGRT